MWGFIKNRYCKLEEVIADISEKCQFLHGEKDDTADDRGAMTTPRLFL